MHQVKTVVLLLLILTVSANWVSAQTILATYEISDHASGLAYDGTYIWYGRYGTNGERVYKFDPMLGQVVDSLDLGAANVDDAYGLTWDGQYLWVCTHVGADFTLQFDTNGNIISSFQNPSDYMSGLAWDGQDLWMADYYNPDGQILKVTTTGQVLESWPAPDNQPWDLAWDGQNLWMADYWGNTIYQIDPVTHSVLYSFPSPMEDPAGIVWDGQYLWLCDEGQGYNVDHLYKIDPFGGGTPEISLSFDAYDFGYIAIGTSPYTTLGITNVGDADLTVTGLPIDQFLGAFSIDPTVTLPFTLTQGSTEQIDIHFSPLNFATYYGLLHVQSDDPINPDVTVDLDGYGIYPIQTAGVSTTNLSFGSVWVSQGDGLTGRAFEIFNHGVPPLNLISLTIDNPVFYHSGFEAGALASMDTLSLIVYFEPDEATAYNGTMTLTTDDPSTPVIDISLSGQGTSANFGQGEVIWQYQVTEPSTFMGFNAITFIDDTNGDGIADVLAANENYQPYCLNGQAAGTGDVFHAFDTGWDPLRTGSVAYERGLTAAPDLNNDSVADYVIGTAGGSRSVFAVSGSDGHELWSFDSHDYGGEGGWVYEVTCEEDWNLDGVFDVLAAVGGPQGSSDPKSVFLLDGVNGNVIWRAVLGQTVYSVRMLGHTNYDLYPEIVCGTSPYSGTYYVKMLNGFDGMVLWTTEVDNVVFSLNRIADLNNDGIYDVVAAAASGGVYALSGINGTVIWHTPNAGTNYYLEVTEDLNGNGYDDVLVTSVSGSFYAYEGLTGATIWSLPLNGNVLSLSATPDFTGDGIADACCGTLGDTFFAVSGAD
ncbi:choice-of-anchor D domain-containing protein, partial [bacterium]|nr:choice-of-anchor D domain-containing protein [bacterium]